MESLRLVEYSDKELLYHIQEAADAEGWSNVRDIANSLGVTHPRPTQCVGARLAWLKRYGVVDGNNGKWRLLPPGNALINSELRSRDQAALDRLDPDQLVMVTRWMTRRQRVISEPMSHLVRREWTHGTYRRNGRR